MPHLARVGAVLLLALQLSIPARSAASETPAAARRAPLILRNVRVVDVARGRILPGRTIAIEGDRIRSVDRVAARRLPSGGRVIDGQGAYVIPGLWDMHVHLFNNRQDVPPANTDHSASFFPAFVANGVTGVRDMFADLADLATIRRWDVEMAIGARLGPRVVGGSPLVDGVPTVWPHALAVGSAAEATRAVDSLVDGGATFIKVYSRLSRDAYFAIAAASKRRSVPFAGHVPSSITLEEASNAGQRTVEHLNGALTGCSEEARARDAKFAAMLRDTTLSRDSLRALRVARGRYLIDRYRERDCAALYATLVRNETWQVPTLSVLSYPLRATDSVAVHDPRLRYVAPEVREEWRRFNLPDIQGARADEVALWRDRFRTYQRIVRAMHAAAVPLLAGTDLHNAYIYPGFSLHDELALLVESGLTPLDALRTATLNPARFLGHTRTLGSVEPGKLADLVLLDANPLADIGNTRRIRAVVMNGRYLDRKALDGLLAEAERAASSGPWTGARGDF